MCGKHEEVRDFAGGLSGCGEVVGSGELASPQADAAVEKRGARLADLSELRDERVEELLDARARQRRQLLKAGGLFGALSAAAPLLASARANEAGASADLGHGAPLFPQEGGKVHVIDSTAETVRWGIFDTNLPNIVEIDSGDVVSLPRTWTHYLNQLQPGVSVDELVALRLSRPGVGPHSIIGPIGVRGAEPGDMIELQYLRIRPYTWGANFHNPGFVGTGALPDIFTDGRVRYFDLDVDRATTEFGSGITLPLQPFQGTLGVAPPDGFLSTPPNYAPGVVSSVPPGPHAGNLDCREAVAGSRVFIPVWKPTAKIFTGDSHALQGDGEVNLTAMETGMEELRFRVVLHKQVGWQWPFHETASAWIAHGTNKDLDLAFRSALLNAIDFLHYRAGLSKDDAYALCSLAVSFRVTQVVNSNKGVYAFIPKSIFHPQLRQAIGVI
jgi:acetamidase/formamidase